MIFDLSNLERFFIKQDFTAIRRRSSGSLSSSRGSGCGRGGPPRGGGGRRGGRARRRP